MTTRSSVAWCSKRTSVIAAGSRAGAAAAGPAGARAAIGAVCVGGGELDHERALLGADPVGSRARELHEHPRRPLGRLAEPLRHHPGHDRVAARDRAGRPAILGALEVDEEPLAAVRDPRREARLAARRDHDLGLALARCREPDVA